MQLGSVRDLEGLKKVLKNSEAKGPNPVYWVFTELSDNKWANLTIITPGDFEGELPKTFGHYNTTAVDEVYHLISGEGILLLQKKTDADEHITEVLLIKVKPGEEVVIKPEYGHSWSNAGEMPLLSFDDWRSGHTPQDYQTVEKLKGMAYYLIREGQEIKAVPNPNYQNLPNPIWLTVDELKDRDASRQG